MREYKIRVEPVRVKEKPTFPFREPKARKPNNRYYKKRMRELRRGGLGF